MRSQRHHATILSLFYHGKFLHELHSLLPLFQIFTTKTCYIRRFKLPHSISIPSVIKTLQLSSLSPQIRYFMEITPAYMLRTTKKIFKSTVSGYLSTIFSKFLLHSFTYISITSLSSLPWVFYSTKIIFENELATMKH